MINWFRIGTAVATVVLLAIMLYGDYEYYFQKPVPIVNNYIVQPGATFNQKNGEKKSQHLFTGIIAGRDSIQGEIGWLW